VATPPGTHLEHALRACRAGKPAYVEKPMARNHDECVAMTAAFEKSRVPLFVAYYRRALPRFLAARDAIASGRIGPVTGVTYRYAAPHHRGIDRGALPWRLEAEIAGGGLFLDLGSHTLDIIDFILGPITSVAGLAANRATDCDVEDSVAMAFSVGGVPGTAHWSFASSSRHDQIEFLGIDGSVSLATFGDEPIEITSGESTEHLSLPNPEHIQQPMVQTVVDALEGRGRCASTAASAARTSAVMDRVLASYYGARSGDFWRHPGAWPGRRGGRPPDAGAA
jgi:1,5-anhydro-D-fructose reductase (1,5-anhydro-D-mannitol-forming)